jgi:hypothetical protein
LPNAGIRLVGGGTGPSQDVVELARDADVFLGRG